MPRTRDSNSVIRPFIQRGATWPRRRAWWRARDTRLGHTCIGCAGPRGLRIASRWCVVLGMPRVVKPRAPSDGGQPVMRVTAVGPHATLAKSNTAGDVPHPCSSRSRRSSSSRDVRSTWCGAGWLTPRRAHFVGNVVGSEPRERARYQSFPTVEPRRRQTNKKRRSRSGQTVSTKIN